MKSWFIVSIFLFCIFSGFSQNTQWRGANFHGHFEAGKLLPSWPENGPSEELVLNNLGRGWSSPVLADDRIFITGKVGEEDVLKVFNLKGEILWEKAFGAAWNKSYSDTRSTPTVHNGKVYVVSGQGNLACFNVENGTLIWEENVDQKFRANWDIWGVSESSLIVDDMVISTPSGGVTAMVALDKDSGELKWKTKSLGGSRMYVSPVLYEFKGVRQIIGQNSEFVYGVNAKNGRIEWTYAFRQRFEGLPDMDNKWPIYANSPIIVDNQIFISQGWNAGSVMLELDRTGKNIKELWMKRTLDNQQYGCVVVDGNIYGSSMHNLKKGDWICLDWKSGRVNWISNKLNKGLVVVADGLMYIYDENGTIALVEPDPDQMKIISSFNLDKGSGQHWASPFISKGKLLIRHGESAVVFSIAN